MKRTLRQTLLEAVGGIKEVDVAVPTTPADAPTAPAFISFANDFKWVKVDFMASTPPLRTSYWELEEEEDEVEGFASRWRSLCLATLRLRCAGWHSFRRQEVEAEQEEGDADKE